MSAKADNAKRTYEEQLSALESRLTGSDHDEAMLGEVGLAMRKLLLRNGGSEAHIRQLLERQFDQGKLRRETYELVERLLGKIVAEESQSRTDMPLDDAPYTQTAVIEQPGQPPAPATVAEQLQVGTVLADRYLLKEQVAEGSMGMVYKALDRRLAETGADNPLVGIKVLSLKLSQNASALRALQQEAAKCRCLAHPNIVKFLDLDREDDLFFIVMEWLDGRSLASILDDNRGSTLDFATAMDIVGQTARALSYAHQLGVVHADVKPGNIIITSAGQAKLIDFGMARVRQKENEGKSRFDPNVMRASSPAYSSMQVLTGEDPAPADDVFSLACLLYRLVAGYRVFGPRNAADAAQEGMEPQQPPELTPEQWQPLKKALAYSRVTRYASPKAFMDAFAKAAGRGAVAPVTPKPRMQAAEPRVQVPEPPVQSPEPMTRIPAQPHLPGSGAEPLPISEDETTQIALDSPMCAEREPIMYEREEEQRRLPWRLVVVGIIVIASTAVVLRPGLLENPGLETPLGSIRALIDTFIVPPGTNEAKSGKSSVLQDLEPLPETEVAPVRADNNADNIIQELVVDPDAGTVAAVDGAEIDENTMLLDERAAAAPPRPLPPPTDFSLLPEPALLMTLRASPDQAVPNGAVKLREDTGDAIVDLVRAGDLAEAYEVRLVETVSSRKRSPGASAYYDVQNDGILKFDPGQPRARITISMHSNNEREADRKVTLSVQDASNPDAILATVNLTLEDDDKRAFEASLPLNTVGFGIDQVSVREFDPAVEIDVIRYHPDSTALEVGYLLTDVTATEGQDYFAPGLSLVYFGPGQRTAKILIPLGHDSKPEQNEVFMLALETPGAPANSNIFSRIAVMIRDDDS